MITNKNPSCTTGIQLWTITWNVKLQWFLVCHDHKRSWLRGYQTQIKRGGDYGLEIVQRIRDNKCSNNQNKMASYIRIPPYVLTFTLTGIKKKALVLSILTICLLSCFFLFEYSSWPRETLQWNVTSAPGLSILQNSTV